MSIATRTEKKRKTTLTPLVPDFCPACDAVDHPFQQNPKKVTQEFRGETFIVDTSSLRCQHCGFEVAVPGSLDAMRLATMDAYRKKHGLLTSAQIIELREMMGMAQREFADYVGVGVASLQRWEKGLVVQDKASDELIRLKTRHAAYVTITLREPSKEQHVPSWSSFVIHAVKDVQRYVAKAETGVIYAETQGWKDVRKSRQVTTHWHASHDSFNEYRHASKRWSCSELEALLTTTG